VRGDGNLRHNSGLTGQLSWLDLVAILLAAATVLWMALRRKAFVLDVPRKRLLLLALAGVLTTFAVASLTWEGIPHATRSLCAWPFVALFTGAVLSAAIENQPEERGRFARAFVVAIAAGFSLFLAATYFGSYAFLSAHSFDSTVKTEAERGRRSADWHRLEWLATLHPKPSMRYYFMHYRGLSCEGSGQLLQQAEATTSAGSAGSPSQK
jgi:hypothetical protein